MFPYLNPIEFEFENKYLFLNFKKILVLKNSKVLLKQLIHIFFFFQIIVGDCMANLDNYIKEGRRFDYVFGDLTDIPLSEEKSGEIWDFIRSILVSSFKVLKPDGKYMTHVSKSIVHLV